MEIWIKIKDFDYEVSNEGRIRNISTGHITLGFKNSDGYMKADLYKNKQRTRFGVHRLVAEYHLPPPSEEQLEWAKSTKWKQVQVNHIDSVRSNNHSSNLEWSTASHNTKHAYSHGAAVKQRGRAKLNWDIVKRIRLEYNSYGGSIIDYAIEHEDKYNVCRKTLRRILYNQTWIE